MFPSRSLNRRQVVTALSCFLMATLAPAQADWSDNFNGGLQQDWQFASLTPDLQPSPTFMAGSVNDQLEITDSTAILLGGAVTGFGFVPEVFGDVMLTGIVNPGNNINFNDTSLMFVRGDVANSTFYAAEVNYSGDQLLIYRADGVGMGPNLVAEPLPSNFTDSFYVEFEAIGANLTARAYDAPGGNLLQTATATDATYSAGVSGTLIDAASGDPTLPILGVWDDMTSSAILPDGDFNDDDLWNCDDINALSAEIVAGTNDPAFDMNGDGQVNLADITDPDKGWLKAGGANNPVATDGNPFLQGDADLSGAVDVSDFNIWNGSKFTAGSDWCAGDFNADGFVDVSDFNLWNSGKFQSSSNLVTVPEPTGLGLLVATLGYLTASFRRRCSTRA